MNEKSLLELLELILELSIDQNSAIINDDMDKLGDIIENKQEVMNFIDQSHQGKLNVLNITNLEKMCLSKIAEQDIINTNLVEALYLDIKKSLKEVNAQKKALNYETMNHESSSLYFDSKK